MGVSLFQARSGKSAGRVTAWLVLSLIASATARAQPDATQSPPEESDAGASGAASDWHTATMSTLEGDGLARDDDASASGAFAADAAPQDGASDMPQTDGGPNGSDSTAPPADTHEPDPASSAPPPSIHDPTPPHPMGPTLSTSDAIAAIFGLVLLLALAYIGGHPRVQRLEQKLRISQVITAGFPFVIIGLISREGGLGILSEPVLDAIRPLLTIGLGWLGFAVGFRFDVRKLDGMPPLAGEAFVTTTAVPYVFIVGSSAALLMLVQESEPSLLVLRDAFVLATAGAMTAIALPSLLERHGAPHTDVDRVGRIIQLEELAALLGILVIGAFFRPDQTNRGWDLPSVGWVFVTVGIGTALAGVIYALLGTIKGSVETLMVMLGAVCFTAGMASYLYLPPVVVCFIAGAVLQNFPGPWKTQVGNALHRVERPVYLLFLLIAGASWRVDEWQGWVLMLAFVAARLLGRATGVALFARRHPSSLSAFERRHLTVSPMGALSVAIIVTAQDLYSGPTVPWMVNAVIGGAILTEIVVQTFAFERPKARTSNRPPTRRSMPVFVLEHARVEGPGASATERPDGSGEA